jgi:hypothetical protein
MYVLRPGTEDTECACNSPTKAVDKSSLTAASTNSDAYFSRVPVYCWAFRYEDNPSPRSAHY